MMIRRKEGNRCWEIIQQWTIILCCVYRIQGCLVPLNDRDFDKFTGDSTKVIVILAKFTFFKIRYK